MFASHPILLTVVIPFRNFDRSAKAMLEAAISAVAPLVDDYELIVVDNGSSNEEFRDYQPLLGGDGFANIQPAPASSIPGATGHDRVCIQ